MCWRKAGELPGAEATGQGVCCLQRLRAKEKGKAFKGRQGKGGIQGLHSTQLSRTSLRNNLSSCLASK